VVIKRHQLVHILVNISPLGVPREWYCTVTQQVRHFAAFSARTITLVPSTANTEVTLSRLVTDLPQVANGDGMQKSCDVDLIDPNSTG
jgi:hypothetical protein